MKHVLPGVALLAVAAGCGGNPATTSLTVKVRDAGAVRSYRLECDPTGGSMRNAEAVCRALRRQPDMLKAPAQVVCGPGTTSRAGIQVTGTDRGTSVRAEFSAVCSSTGDGFGAWDGVLHGAGPGSPAS